MLTLEQKRQRAINISKLYFEPKKQARELRYKSKNTFKWSRIISLSLALALPFVMANIVYAIFIGFDYKATPDIAVSSVIFIPIIASVAYWMFVAPRHFIDQLGGMVVNALSIFWLTFLFLVPLFMFARYLIIDNLGRGVPEPVSGMFFYILVPLIMSVVAVLTLTCILDRIKQRDTVKTRLAITFTALPYLIGLIAVLCL